MIINNIPSQSESLSGRVVKDSIPSSAYLKSLKNDHFDSPFALLLTV